MAALHGAEGGLLFLAPDAVWSSAEARETVPVHVHGTVHVGEDGFKLLLARDRRSLERR